MITNRHPERWGSVLIPARVAERAANKFVVVGECHLSKYSVGSHGYSQIGWHGDDGVRRCTTAHRAAYVHHNGLIPVGMTVDHRHSVCLSRRCVRREHLRLLTNLENARRTFGRDWPVGVCIEGHPNDEMVLRGGKHVCKPCSDQWQRDYRQRRHVA